MMKSMENFSTIYEMKLEASEARLPLYRRGACRLEAGESVDLGTYFNAFSLGKWLRYTTLDALALELCFVGTARVVLYGWDESGVQEVASDVAENGWCWQAGKAELIALGRTAVLLGVRMEAEEGTVELMGGRWRGSFETERDIHVGAVICTYHREKYLHRNLDLLGSYCKANPWLTVMAIDNGQTLGEHHDGWLTILPNRNYGGSGGFTRGLIEQMGAGVNDYFLLMDDDVEMSPESFIRTFAILSLVNDEYKDAFLSGAMMDYDVPDNRWEDLGYMTGAGACRAVKPDRIMSVLHNIVKDETFEPDYASFGDLSQMYAAWWYCCIPLTQIRKNGMPLPIFVRYDDIEYGQRCAPKFMTMTGICVWHLNFHMRYNEAVERYQTTRNSLITQFTTGVSPQTNFLAEITYSIRTELIKFNYSGAEILLEGFEDFLKGPEFIAQRGIAEKTFMDANRKKEKLVPLEEIRDDAFALTGIDILEIGHDAVEYDIPYTGTHHGIVFDMGYRQILKRTLNNQLFGNIKPARRNTEIIEAYGWVYPVGKIAGVEHLVVIDVPNQKGVIRHRNPERCKELWKRFQDDLKTFKKESARLHEEYSSARAKLTSAEFWREYLGLN